MIQRILITLIACAFLTPAAGQIHAGGMPSPQSAGMYALDLSSGQVQPIGPLRQGVAAETAWSPDSTRVAVASNSASGDTIGGLQIVDLRSGATKPIASAEQGEASELRWSPDGSQLAFVFRSRVGEFGEGGASLQIWRSSDGTLFSPVRSGARLLAWKPDGSALAVAIGTGAEDPGLASSRIVTVDAKTGQVKDTVLSGPATVCQLGIAWSPDGRYLAYGGSGFHEGCIEGVKLGLWSWDSTSGTTSQLFDGTASAPLFMTDGSVLAKVAPVGGPGGLGDISLSAFQPGGSGQRVLAASMPNMFPPPSPAFSDGSRRRHVCAD